MACARPAVLHFSTRLAFARTISAKIPAASPVNKRKPSVSAAPATIIPTSTTPALAVPVPTEMRAHCAPGTTSTALLVNYAEALKQLMDVAYVRIFSSMVLGAWGVRRQQTRLVPFARTTSSGQEVTLACFATEAATHRPAIAAALATSSTTTSPPALPVAALSPQTTAGCARDTNTPTINAPYSRNAWCNVLPVKQ